MTTDSGLFPLVDLSLGYHCPLFSLLEGSTVCMEIDSLLKIRAVSLLFLHGTVGVMDIVNTSFYHRSPIAAARKYKWDRVIYV
jgi:hypothetical protein